MPKNPAMIPLSPFRVVSLDAHFVDILRDMQNLHKITLVCDSEKTSYSFRIAVMNRCLEEVIEGSL